MRHLLKKAYYMYHDFRAKGFTKDHPRYAAYEIGDYSYGFPEVYDWHDGTTLKIGKFCSISKGVKIYLGGQHRVDWVSTFPFNEFFDEAKHITGHPTSKGDIVLENDVWIGGDATILSGVTLSNGCVVGAGSVVTKDVPPYAMAAGNPAKIIKYRFDEKTIAALLEMQWWDWPIANIKQNVSNIMSTDIEKFIKIANK